MRISDWSSDVCSSDLGILSGGLCSDPGRDRRRPPAGPITPCQYADLRGQEFRRILRGPLPADLCLDRAAAVVRSAFHFAHHRILFLASQRTMPGPVVCATSPLVVGLSVCVPVTDSGLYA